MTIAIKVENLSKSYLLGHNAVRNVPYTALRDVITHSAKKLGQKTLDMFQGKAIVQGDYFEEFLALNDVSFEIKQGDRVGIIGRNGAGKSTLLKILSRITEPSKGRITLNGRIASLLEVGTGFHPELSGRENIFLNGAILGMSRKEIQRKFDEIVDFADVEKFLDTPVKRYSSGMYVRLAFAVAAHLEPEILIVDEVLAVGDAQFQKKCLGKMEEVSTQGRTILFVSHQLGSVQALCNRTIHLAGGCMIDDGDSQVVIKNYLAGLTMSTSKNIFSEECQTSRKKGLFWLTDAFALNEKNEKTSSLIAGDTVTFAFQYSGLVDAKDLHLVFTIFNSAGIAISNIHTKLHEKEEIIIPKTGIFKFVLPRLPLAVDDYRIAVALSSEAVQLDLISSAIQFSVVDSIFFGSSRVPPKAYALTYLEHSWSVVASQSV